MRITSAQPLPGFRLRLRFDNGAAGEVDLSSFAGRGVFAVWNTDGVFEQVRVTDQGAVEWPGSIRRSRAECLMPEISRFYGIVVPHFHAIYGGQTASTRWR